MIAGVGLVISTCSAEWKLQFPIADIWQYRVIQLSGWEYLYFCDAEVFVQGFEIFKHHHRVSHRESLLFQDKRVQTGRKNEKH